MITLPASTARQVLGVRRRKRRSAYVYRKVRARRRQHKTIPISVAASLGATFLVPPKPGYDSPLNLATQGRWAEFGQTMLRGWIGYNTGTSSFAGEIPEYLKIMIAGVLVHKAANMLHVGRIFRNFPAPFNKLSI